MRVASLIAIALVAAGCRRAHDIEMRGVPLRLDQEQRLADSPLTSATQSVNRYRSVLSRFGAVDLRYDARSGRLQLRFDDEGAPADRVTYEQIDARFVLPLLPYPHGRTLSRFDALNLMLAEYSRNGVELLAAGAQLGVRLCDDAGRCSTTTRSTASKPARCCPTRARGPNAWRWSTTACFPGCGS